jgi:hypothetical protein
VAVATQTCQSGRQDAGVSNIPRPDVDRLLWLVGCEAGCDGPLAPRGPWHAVRDGTASCGYEGDLVVRDCLWVDWSTLTFIGGPEPCTECGTLVPVPSRRDVDSWVELYSGRSSEKNRAIRDRLVELEPPPGEAHRWDYRIDIGRAQFEDGIGDFFRITRGRIAADHVKKKPRRLP